MTLWRAVCIERCKHGSEGGTGRPRPGFSFLPYDSGGGGRLEARFLHGHLKYLAPKGWLIFIIPLVALRSVKDSLSQLRNLQIYAFPEPEYAVFKQVVVMGQNSRTSKSDEQLAMLNALVYLSPADAWEKLPKTTEIPKGSIVLPPSPAGRLVFDSERSNMERAAELVAKSPLWIDFEVITTPESLHQVEPLAPLRKGHQATLLASGLMNGEVESNGRHLVIKGSVNKSADVTTEITDSHKIETRKEKFHIGIRAIDLDTKGIFQIS
ncbi:MAG: DUF6094 domain-containing protein [Thermodesulfobacteriota bacterium]